jgi:hypothetical protein
MERDEDGVVLGSTRLSGSQRLHRQGDATREAGCLVGPMTAADSPSAISVSRLKQIRMRSGSFEPNFIIQNLINQQPIRLDIAVPMTCPIPTERVIAVLLRKGFLCQKQVDDHLDFCKVLASLLQPLDVLLELTGLAEPHLSQEA